MEQSAGTSMDLKGDKKNRGCIAVHNVMKKDHAKPPENAHGLCLANPRARGARAASRECKSIEAI
jgi:hypothetical protein